VWLRSLEQGVRENSTNAARAAVRSPDPLLRLIARARLARQWQAAENLVGPSEPAHLMRVAALRLMGEDGEFMDAEWTRKAFEERVVPALSRPVRSHLTLAVVLALLVSVVSAVVARYATRPFDPRGLPGVAVVEEALAPKDAASWSPKAEVVRRVLATERAQSALGPALANALVELAIQSHQLAEAEPDGQARLWSRYIELQKTVNRSLGERRIPLFIDTTLLLAKGGPWPLHFLYYAEKECAWEYQQKPLHSVFAWRLDEAPVRLPALGYVRDGSDTALINYDLIETVLLQHLLVSLADKEPARVFDEETRLRGDERVLLIEARIGELIRQGAPSVTARPATKQLARLLSTRRHLVDRWRRTITGFPIIPPERLVRERELSERMVALLSRSDVAEWERTNDALTERVMVEEFERQRDAWAAVVERHELQHLMDAIDGLSGIPVVLARRLAVDPATEPPPNSLFAAARAELSAYLAEVAGGPSPRLSLILLTTALFDRNLGGQPHQYAALAIFDGLMKELRIDQSERGYEDWVLDVLAADPERLGEAARNLYEGYFGRPLGTPAWRHTEQRTRYRH
jgi:hypothetical protein